MIDEKEIEWWCKEYPDLDREEIIDVLEIVEEYHLNIENDD